MYTLIKLGWCPIKQGSPIPRPWHCSLISVSPWPVGNWATPQEVSNRWVEASSAALHLSHITSCTIPFPHCGKTVFHETGPCCCCKRWGFLFGEFSACPEGTLNGWFWDSLEGLLETPPLPPNVCSRFFGVGDTLCGWWRAEVWSRILSLLEKYAESF